MLIVSLIIHVGIYARIYVSNSLYASEMHFTTLLAFYCMIF